MIKSKTTSKINNWNLNQRFKVGETVQHNGSYWISRTGKNVEPTSINSNDWSYLGRIDEAFHLQNNKARVIDFGTASNVGNGIVNLASAVNNLPSFTLAQDEVLYLTGIVIPLDRSVTSYQKTYVLENKGQGDYGSGGVVLVNSDFKEISSTLITTPINPASTDPNAHVEDLGEIGNTDFLSIINTHTPAYVIQAGTNWYFEYTNAGKRVLYGFDGANGNYGQGNLQMTSNDIFLIYSEVNPAIPKNTSDLINDGETTGAGDRFILESNYIPPLRKIPLTVNNLFNYLPFEISSFNDENFYSKNLDILSNFKANTVIGAGITYVDAINGLDTNNGTQISRPKKTIAAALALGSSTIFLKNGYYDKFDWRFDSPLGNRSRVIIGIGDNVVFGVKGDVLQSFSTSPFGTATLQMTLLTNDNLLVLTRKDQLDNDGQPTPIPKRASATEVNSSGYGWFYDTTTKLLTVRLDDPTLHGANATERELWFNTNIAPLLKPIYTPTTNPFIRAYSNHIYFKNCKFEGIYLWALKHAANPKSSIYLEDCELKYSPAGGLIVDDSDYVLKDTYITRSQGDNIGIHEQTAGTVPEGIEINVKSTYAGDIDTYGTAIVENRNASSVHENCNVIRIGGEYAYSFGPNVIDVGVDANSVGVSYNLNVKAHTSLATTSNTDFETYNFRKVYLSNCKALYNGKIAVRTNAEIIYDNLIYNNILLQTGGLFTKYQF